MTDLKERILEITGMINLATLATTTKDGKPWCRYVMINADNDLVFRCATKLDARKVEQIEMNPEVHLTCGITAPDQIKPYLQVQGRAAVLTTSDAKESFWFPPLAQIFTGPDDPNYSIVEITAYRIEFCDQPTLSTEIWERDS